jgi:hypothetical protein
MCNFGKLVKRHGNKQDEFEFDRWGYREDDAVTPAREAPRIAKTGRVESTPDYPIQVPASVPYRDVPVMPSRRHETIRRVIQDVPPFSAPEEVPQPEKVRVRR